jgi:hypothetical protein
MRGVALIVLLAGCDGIWDLERLPQVPDAKPDATIPQELIAWFPLDDVALGTVIEAVAGQHGSCAGSSCPTPTPGVVDGALLFDGSSQVVTATPATALNTAASFTVAVWTRMDLSVPEGFACVVSKRYGAESFNSWQLCTFFDTWRFVSVTTMIVGPNARFGTWQHFAATWDAPSTQLQLYVDGEPYGAAMFVDLTFDDGALLIGADVDGTSVFGYFPGAIDDLRVYNRALDAAQIQKLATPQ